MIPVTKPFLPPLEEYADLIKGVWHRAWLTNNGPLVNEFESKLSDYLNLEKSLFVTNGTVAIQLAIKALNLQGQILTTPFSFIATASSIVWEGCEPVFVDIDRATLNIDPDKIENSITPKTSAILATHVYGNPCDILRLEDIARRHNLKLIYDAAHAFGVKVNGESIFKHGDVSTTSFHSTKLFHTTEGGAIFSDSDEVLARCRTMMNFGHEGPVRYVDLGINGKNSELHAAMGLCILPYADQILEKRKADFSRYKKQLNKDQLSFQEIADNVHYNYSYFPVIFPTENHLIMVKSALEEQSIFARRYFYPTLDMATYLKPSETIPVAKDISSRILCLPLYYNMTTANIDFISNIVNKSLEVSK